ncbi:MAG TPA: ATP-binding protein [Anaerolineae bacterium]|nr:ATP-binding protein [Anaerolineae bacterium]
MFPVSPSIVSTALRLVEPASSLQEPEARLNARLLATLLLALAGMHFIGALLVSSMAGPAGEVALLCGATSALLSIYVLSRTKYYKWAAALSILLTSLLPYLTLALAASWLTPEQLFFSLSMLFMPIVLANLFFTVRITAICAGLINLSLLLLPLFIPSIDWTVANAALGLILTVSVLVIVLMNHRERIERARQAALAESEARYRRLADNALDVIYRHNFVPEDRFTYINPAVSDILGYTPEEFYADRDLAFNLVHPDDRSVLLAMLTPDAPRDKPITLRWLRKDGAFIWIEHRHVPIIDQAGNLIAIEGIARDITDRKQAEMQIERNVRQLAALEHMGQTVVASLDLAVVLERVIEQISTLLGAEGVSVLLSADHDELVFVATNSSSAALIGQRMPIGAGIAGEVIRTGQSVRVHDQGSRARIYRDIDQTNGFHTESLLAVPLKLRGDIIGVMEAVHTQPGAFSSDDLRLLEAAASWATVAITKARLFEAEHRRVQEQIALLEITQMALSSFELSAPVLRQIAQRTAQACHASQCLLFRFEERADAIRPLVAEYADGRADPDIQAVLKIIAPEQLDTLPALRTLLNERRPHLFKDAQRASLLPDEWRRLFGLQQALAVPLLSQTKAIGLMIVGYESDQNINDSYFDLALTIGAQIASALTNLDLYADLQRALQHEREARAQVVQAEKLAALGRLAASVAHELNNPLQVIQNSLYLVRQESTLDRQAQADLDVALTENRRMADLIERMRETYRPTAATEFRPESLNALIAEVEKLISTHLRHNAVTFEFKPDPQLPLVPCLRDQLKQVILNVSLNAVDAMPHGGRLTISTATSPTADGLWVTIADTGQGIAPQDLPNIFDPFFTRKAGGTGLGLSISYDIVQQHHGRIEVESEIGRGTTFRIWLPLKGQ